MGPGTGAWGNPRLGAVGRASNAVPIGDTRELPGVVLVSGASYMGQVSK